MGRKQPLNVLFEKTTLAKATKDKRDKITSKVDELKKESKKTEISVTNDLISACKRTKRPKADAPKGAEGPK